MISSKDDTILQESSISKFVNLQPSVANKTRPVYKTEVVIKEKQNNLIPAFILVIIAMSYYFLHTNLNIYYEDDSWTLSNAWNLMVHGVDKDLIFLDQDGAFTGQLFGKLYFITIGSFLNLVGWSKSNAFLFNSSLVMLAAWVWHSVLKELKFSKKVVQFLPLFIPIFPPVFFAAHTGRTDAFTFLLMSIGILLFVKKHYVPACLVAILAIESHIMGVVTLFYYAAYFLSQQTELKLSRPIKSSLSIIRSNSKILIECGIGAVIGIGLYMMLHFQTFDLQALTEIIKSKSNMVSPVNNYILAYFTDFDWIHHLPEFGLLATTVYLYSKEKLYRKNKFLFFLLLLLVLSTLITRRENRNYFIYLAPCVLMLYFYTFSQIKKTGLLVGALATICIVYFSSIYYKNHDFKFDQFVSFVQDNTKADIPIVGMPDVWFAATDKEYYPIHNERDFNKIELEEFYLIETDYLSRRSRVYTDIKDNIHSNYDCKKTSEWVTYDGNTAAVCHCKNDGIPNKDIIYKPYPGWRTVMKNFMPSASL